MARNLHITGPAQKLRLPAKDQARVKNVLLAMQQDPFSGDTKRIKRQAAARAKVEARDLELINTAEPELNEEVEDILRYHDRALKKALALD
jgi:hypothetical protein